MVYFCQNVLLLGESADRGNLSLKQVAREKLKRSVMSPR